MTQAFFGDNKNKLIISRSSRRIGITIPHSIAKHLEEQSVREGRSLSNLAAYLLEKSLSEIENTLP